jgi:aspartokinase/homoserine dehydrogenase 1
MEIEVENESFLPAACMETTNNADFFKSIVEHATHFEAILAEANKSRLKFVAQFENAKPALVYNSSQKTILL